MLANTPDTRIATFGRSSGLLHAIFGGLFIGAACVGVVMATLMLRHPDLETIVLIALGFAGSCALGAAFLNAWRSPALVVRPGVVTIQTLFGTRDIPVRPGQPVGEYLASSMEGGTISGTVEDNKFVHFYVRDGNGELVELVALHRATPVLVPIRQALVEIAGLRIDRLKPVHGWMRSRPDVSHWK